MVAEADVNVARHTQKQSWLWHYVYQRKRASGNGEENPRDWQNWKCRGSNWICGHKRRQDDVESWVSMRWWFAADWGGAAAVVVRKTFEKRHHGKTVIVEMNKAGWASTKKTFTSEHRMVQDVTEMMRCIMGSLRSCKGEGAVAVRIVQRAEHQKVWNVHFSRCARRAETMAKACLAWTKMGISKWMVGQVCKANQELRLKVD